MLKRTIISLLTLCIGVTLFAQQQTGYMEPPKVIKDLVLAPSTPDFSMSPKNDCYAVLESTDIPTIADMAMEEYKLAGVRVLPSLNSVRFRTKYHSIVINKLPGFKSTQIEGNIKGFPNNANIVSYSWSPDGNKMALLLEEANGIYLWIAEINTLSAKQLSKRPLNLFFGPRMLSWSPDSKSIIVPFIPENRGRRPQQTDFKIVPVIQESDGENNPTETYQDLLKDKYSEILFDYYATSEIGIVSTEGGEIKTSLGKGIYSQLSWSPDGKYILSQRIHAPYSYVVPYYYFPSTTQVMTVDGAEAKTIFEKPLVETDFINKNSTSPYPRGYSWRSDRPATLCWIEPLDGGNGRTKVEYRDKIVMSDYPFTSGEELFKTKFRFRDIIWGNDNNAFVMMYDYATRMEKCLRISVIEKKELGVIYNQSNEELYGDMGRIITSKNSYGRSVALSYDNYKTIFFTSNGYSPDGALPLISRYNIKSKKSECIWRSINPYYEKPIEFLDLSKGLFISQRESNYENPNFFLNNLKKKETIQLTSFVNPYEAMKGVTKEQVEYVRKDGVKLSGTLYLPAGYKKSDGPLPLLIWAYPAEYKNKEAAQQRGDAPNQFIRYTRSSSILYVAAGYAVLNNAAFPIIGEGDKEPNDTYVEQLVGNAAAAIDKLAEMGVADRARVAVSGHSYGAFMTVNLLANCNLFAAGIARSGAYNRTLTPFGFQNEMRTLWEAPKVYLEMSPFMKADKLKTPLLLIHGINDNNTGTFPIQSERMYSALKGNGGKVRLVMLPYESHGYSAKESLLQQAYETYTWLEKYVKNKK
jgi:dipeptidyl aminopeptidase/acylaminoacyl peptidase